LEPNHACGWIGDHQVKDRDLDDGAGDAPKRSRAPKVDGLRR
jgi:hypothetical protein